ncbi:GNAT family N-acetyltransferase [Roseibacillus persicicus]|uniref:GNAT family N-acetyltransferase n=1 Tax=Roseibacillus persicicus TaxID=454148 RepID=UPI00398ABCC4
MIQIHRAPFGWHATVGGKAAGVVRVAKQGDEIVLLGDIEVYPEYRKRGVGSQLLRALLQHAQENEVRELCDYVMVSAAANAIAGHPERLDIWLLLRRFNAGGFPSS